MFYIFNNLYNKIFYKNFIYKKEAGKNIERGIKLESKKDIEILLELKEAKYNRERINALQYLDEEDDCHVLTLDERQTIETVLNRLENDEKIINYIFKHLNDIAADCTKLSLKIEPEYQQCRKSNSFNCSYCIKNYIENILNTKECKKDNEENCRKEKLGCEGCYYYK